MQHAEAPHGEFWKWVDELPDLIALHDEQGRPITVRDPGTDFGRRLLHTLGANVTVGMTLQEYVDLLDRAEGRA